MNNSETVYLMSKDTHKRIQADALDLLTEVKSHIKDKQWQNRGTHNGILMESKEFGTAKIPCYLFSTYSIKPIDELLNSAWNVNEEILKQDDPSITKWKIIEKDKNDNCMISVIKQDLPWPIWPREVVIAQFIIREVNANWIIIWSVNHDRVPENPDESVRAKVIVSCYGFIEVQNKVKIYRLSIIDPRGLIPSDVIDLFAHKQMKPLLRWR